MERPDRDDRGLPWLADVGGNEPHVARPALLASKPTAKIGHHVVGAQLLDPFAHVDLSRIQTGAAVRMVPMILGMLGEGFRREPSVNLPGFRISLLVIAQGADIQVFS